MNLEQMTMDLGIDSTEKEKVVQKKDRTVELLPLNEYNRIICNVSAGKDSVAQFLQMMDYVKEGVIQKEQLEIWHQSIDGGGSDKVDFMDYPITEPYVQALGDYFGVPVYFMWREQGFYGELTKENRASHDIKFVDENGELNTIETKKDEKYWKTRMKWPMLTPDLSKRYCSGQLKIDVSASTLRNWPRFKKGFGNAEVPKILFLTGERREESSNRAKYDEKIVFEKANAPSLRIVHHWRSIIDWKEEQVWDIIERYKVRPHPAYELGFSRVSCFGCIYSSPEQYLAVSKISPTHFNRLCDFEEKLGHTIKHEYEKVGRKKVAKEVPLVDFIKQAKEDILPIENPNYPTWVKMLLSHEMKVDDIIMEDWKLPKGAFLGSCGGPE